MKKTLRKTSAILCAITVVASSMSLSGFVANAGDEPVTSDYTITIPATLAVVNSGWNALEGGISAKGTLESGKKLVITPTSENGWKLVSGDNNVGYNLAKETGTYSAAAEAPTWEFTELTADGTSQTAGIIVENYDSKPAGDYSDTVTFTASVVSAAKKLTLTGRYMDDNTMADVTKSLEIEYTDNDTWKDIAERYDEVSLVDNFFGPSEGKIVRFWADMRGCELKSNESTYTYNLVSINDKVSAYSSYYLQG